MQHSDEYNIFIGKENKLIKTKLRKYKKENKSTTCNESLKYFNCSNKQIKGFASLKEMFNETSNISERKNSDSA